MVFLSIPLFIMIFKEIHVGECGRRWVRHNFLTVKEAAALCEPIHSHSIRPASSGESTRSLLINEFEFPSPLYTLSYRHFSLATLNQKMSQKIVICGAGFLGLPFKPSRGVASTNKIIILGSNIARALSSGTSGSRSRRVQLSSRSPEKIQASLTAQGVDTKNFLPPVPVDITKPATLASSFEGADVIGNYWSIMYILILILGR